jgi:hypothetical protein
VKRAKSNGSHSPTKSTNGGNGHAIVNGNGKVGRPTKYQPEFVKQAEKLCKLGATDAELADFFGVGISTLYRWFCSRPEFREAIKTPKEVADSRAVRSLYMNATGFWVDTEKLFVLKDEEYDDDGHLIRVTQRVHHEPTREYYRPETAAAFIWLKNRQPDKWRDKHEVDVSGKIENVFTLNIFEHDLSGNMKVIEGKKSVPRLRSK